jgi:polar amino acid transport system substrate-binding protein
LRHYLLFACLIAAPTLALAQSLTQAQPPAQETKLRAGVVASAPPFVLSDARGDLSGFVIDLFRAIAARMQRDIVFIPGTPESLAAGLANGTLDLLPGPINATPDRAAEMLLTEGYLWSEFQFSARASEPVTKLEDLRGRRLAVKSASPYAEWANRNAGRYGFTVVSTATGLEAAEAVLAQKADASLSSSPVLEYAAWKNHGLVAGLTLPETRTHESAAVRKADTELRDEVEDALRCLKLNGTVARLSQKWLGHEPDAEDLENLLVPGYGVPGLAGYDPKSRKARC